MEYMKVPAAALYIGTTPQLVYKQMKRYVIKSKKIDGVLHTTPEWLDEYLKMKDCKDHHARWNGRPVFDEEKGLLSVNMVAARLGMARMNVLNRIMRGEICAIRRGSYYVIPQAQLDLYLQEQQKKTA
jgi:hypothetical protein